jgi:hypothetical protein
MSLIKNFSLEEIMETKNNTKIGAIVIIIMVLLSTIACGFDFGIGDDSESVSIQQTNVALQLTMAALESQQPTDPEEDLIEIATPIPDPTDTPEAPDISYEGISFYYDQDVVRNIIPSTIQGQNLGESAMPSDTYPTYFEFTLENYAVSDHFHDPKIRVYPVEEFQIISPYASNTIDNLQQTLNNQPEGGLISNLPFLPMFNAAQLFSAKVEYFDFQNGSGIRYLTMYGQGISPVDNTNLFYTYQGITNDGRYYISAILPVINIGLPNDGSSQIEDYYQFEENWEEYLSETLTWLEEQAPQNFFPNLEKLDLMLASFEINR